VSIQNDTSLLDAALAAARWIRSTEQPSEYGLVWQPDPDQPERSATVTAPATIYSGNAGVVLFFLELAQATGEQSYLEAARLGADHIVETWREVLDYSFFLDVRYDFNHGLAGTAFVLAHVWRATDDPRYRAAAVAITERIIEAAQVEGDGIRWIGASSAALGDGATVLYLLWAANALEEPRFREAAARAGRLILSQAEPDPRGGWRWVAYPMEQIGAPNSYMPNFEFGTAGVALVMARLYAETGESAFLEAAKQGAAHVQALATVRDDAALLFHREPDMTDLFYLGYCGGPVGTARIFYELYRLTGEQEYRKWLERFARGISTSGVPERQTPGLWNVVCQCCGTAGIVDFFTSLGVALSSPEHLAYARRVAEQTLSRATDFDGKGLRWYQAWTRTKPWEVTAETGYMIGAAGVGSSFLHLHLAEQQNYQAILFPDNPFPEQHLA
jgi:lantibiotic modifying enzyme